MIVHVVPILAGLILSFIAGALTMWWLLATDDAHTAELLAREDALRTRLRDLETLLNVPPLFWKVWDRYTVEQAQQLLEEFISTGKHAQPGDSAEGQDQPGDQK